MDAKRFHALVLSMGYEPDSCWVWPRAKNKDGYTHVYFEGKQIGTHRASHMVFKGPIPPEFTIDHLCRNRACINPAHLEAVTLRENILRGECEAARNRRRETCIRGHQMIFSVKSGHRWCQECARMRRLRGFVPKHPDGKRGAHKKLQCKNGHVYDGTETLSKGGRVCKECRRAIEARYRNKLKAST
jgi:hypothetical protein